MKMYKVICIELSCRYNTYKPKMDIAFGTVNAAPHCQKNWENKGNLSTVFMMGQQK